MFRELMFKLSSKPSDVAFLRVNAYVLWFFFSALACETACIEAYVNNELPVFILFLTLTVISVLAAIDHIQLYNTENTLVKHWNLDKLHEDAQKDLK